MICITRKILDWSEKKYDEASEPGEKHPIRKAVVSGFVDGFVDVALFSYSILMVSCVYWRKKAK